jgi:hypothetical protein
LLSLAAHDITGCQPAFVTITLMFSKYLIESPPGIKARTITERRRPGTFLPHATSDLYSSKFSFFDPIKVLFTFRN